MLKIENLLKTYRLGAFGNKELKAVSDVSFNVHDREVVSLIGESGSGKSTIGKMILRLISKSGGTIEYNGLDIAELKGSQLKEYYRSVQGVFQDPFSSYNPIFKADRVYGLLHAEFFPEIGDADWKARVNNSLESVGLNPQIVLNKFPHQLSGGQLQRLLIARALLLDIKFLVADEIISMLDASTRIDVLNLLAGLKKQGLSLLFITHDLSLGYYISDQSVILYKGHIVERGSTVKIYNNPLHPYTKMLMASVPRLDRKWEGIRESFQGKSLKNAGGCVYFERCPLANATWDCAKNQPPLVEAEADHFAACCCYQS